MPCNFSAGVLAVDLAAFRQGRLCRRLAQRVDRQQDGSGRDRHVGDVENTGADRTDADIEKIDHAAVVGGAVDEIAEPTAAQKRERKYLARRQRGAENRVEKQGREKHSDENREGELPPGVWKRSAQTQKSAGVLGVLQPEKIS